MTTTRKTRIAIAASAVGGMAAGATLFVPAVAGAEDDARPPVEIPSAETAPEGRLSDALQPLVDDGTITSAQRDAVVAHLDSVRPRHRPRHQIAAGEGPLGDVADLLALDDSELMAALRDGTTVADLAAERGIDTDEVVGVIVANIEAHLDEAVDAGEIDAARAADLLDRAEDRAIDMVNGERFPRRPRPQSGA